MHPEAILPPLPARSRLYNLPPHGLGTTRTESLTGYVARLAKAHCVSVGSLLNRGVHGHLHEDDPGSRVILSPDYLRSMNGLDAVAATWTRALEELTCRSDLRFLTMFTWADVLSSRGLMRRNRAWCPACYEEDAEPYEHLLWCLEPVTVCSHHARALETKCPHCRRGLPVISWRSAPGFCSSCFGWLGVPAGRRCASDAARSVSESKWDYAVVESLGELLSVAPSLKDPPGRARIAWSLVTLTGLTEARAIAQKLDVNYVTAWTWSTGGVRLLVSRLLSICAKLGVSAAEFLTSEAFAPSTTDVDGPLVPAAPAAAPRSTGECRRRSAALLKRARKFLQKAIETEIAPPPSFDAMCREGGFTTPYMYRQFPDLCRVLSARWKAWKRQRGANRRERLADEVRDAATRLHAEGIIPSTLNVARSLSQPGAIRDPAARATLRNFRMYLDLEGPDDTPK